MTTAAQQHHDPQQPQVQPHLELAGGTYDPDEVVPHDSPLMKPLYPKLRPSPSPPPDIPPAQVSLKSPPTDGPSTSNRHKIRPSFGDAVLVAYLDNGRRPEIARVAGRQALRIDEELEDEDYADGEDDDDYDDNEEYQDERTGRTCLGRRPVEPGDRDAPSSLQNLAAGALKVVAAEPTHDISASTRQLSIRDDRHVLPVAYPRRQSPRPAADHLADHKPSPAMLTPGSGELPPLLDSPRSEANGQSLPSILSTLGDIKRLPTEPPPPLDSELSARHGHGSAFPRSPPAGVPRLQSIPGGHVSPPISPSEAYQRSLPSPRSMPASSPYYYGANGPQHRPSVEYSSSSATGETPSTEHTASTPATSASVADRMSIDGLTNPQQFGVYVCTFSGCTAPPFQTQYLLNSHANVHSSARPHYCPVQGCPRSEGGKGFKRKNEMIRHGLVHDSPGYVCPFCPDREHRYPRPDNLQRHVRVHHVDKDKDDPQLRDVLAQRPDGPNRGRRRRGAPS